MDPQLANLNLDPPRPSSLLRRGLLPALLVNALFFGGIALSLQWPGSDRGHDDAARMDTGNDTRSMGAAPATAAGSEPPAPTMLPRTQSPSQPQPQGPAPQPQLQMQPQLQPQPPSTDTAVPPAAPPMGTTAQQPAPARTQPAPRAETRPRHQVAMVDPSATRQATGVAVQPSFDCGKARSRTERLICSDPELAQLDRDTGRLHARAKAAARDPVAFKRQNDREWKQREADCRDKACLLAWYAHRREQLQETVAQAR